MPLEQYFKDELAYLRLQGREFASEHPDLTRFLSEQTTDPDVERLLEGFAFLTGSLRAKIEDEFPELTHGLLSLLWPNYLRPVPSMTIMQFSVIPGAIMQPTQVKRGSQLDSLPIDEVTCHFQTCHDTWIYPADIYDINAQSGNDFSTISVEIRPHTPLSVSELQLDKLRFYLGGDNYSANELYHWLSTQLAYIELEINGQRFRQPASLLKPVGFEPHDALLPYPSNVYSGYRILQEFFCFPESFLFFGFSNANWSLHTSRVSQFTLHFCFERPLPAGLHIRSDSLLLNCVPAINLFSYDSEPISFNGRQTEYPLKVSYRYADSFEIFSINNVESWAQEYTGRSRGAVRVYQPFESFQHQIEQVHGRLALYYRSRVREAVSGGGFDYSLSFVRSDEAEMQGVDESISVSLTCTNREKASQLPIGAVCVPTGSSPSFATFKNLLRPTRPLRPILDSRLHWALISNLSLNYVSLLHKEALIQILRTYDFPALQDKQAELISRKRLAGIEKIETQPVDRLVQGMPVRGLKSVLSLRQSAFGSEGELYLFSTVLAHFFSLYASVNAFHLLEVINLDSKECYRWPVQIGQHALM